VGKANLVLRAIGDEDVGTVAAFFGAHLNNRVPPARWRAVLAPPWPCDGPNRGVALIGPDGEVVGAYAAVYSTREVAGSAVRFCNLAAFCVLEEHRVHSIRLMRALLDQRGFVFTDLSPSGNVVALDERLGFVHLDTATRLVANLPRPRRRGVFVTDDHDELAGVLKGRDAAVHRDHRDAPAARHLAIVSDGGYAYLIYRRDRRKGRRLFASPLYAGGDRDLLRSEWGTVACHLLGRAGLPFTLAERRVLGFDIGPGRTLAQPRPKMFRGDGVGPDDIDYLYSELALLEW
jgi:hypothetical protein